MANRYANLVGSNKIKDEYTKINQGFDKVQQDVDKLHADLDQEIADREAAVEYVDQRIDQIIQGGGPDKDAELVDIRTTDPSYTPERTINVAGDVTRDMQAQFVAHKADLVQRGVNVANFGAQGGTTSETSQVQAAIDEAVSLGINKIFIPFPEITVGVVDCKGCIVIGNQTALNGRFQNASLFVDVKINNQDTNNIQLEPHYMPTSVSPKILYYTSSTPRYYVISRKANGKGYVMFFVEGNVVSSNTERDYGSPGELLRVTRAWNVLDAWVYKHSRSAVNGTWETYNYSFDNGRSIKFWRNTSQNSSDYIEFNIDVPDNGRISMAFYMTGSSSNAATVKADGNTIGTVDLSNTTNRILIKEFEAKPGQRTIRVTAEQNTYVYVAGVNFYHLKDADIDREYDDYAYERDTNDYISNNGSCDYAFVDADTGKYFGSYHGGETSISESIMVDGDEVNLSINQMRVGNNIQIDQVTDLIGKLTSHTTMRWMGDGVFEFSAQLSGDVDVTTAYTAMTTTAPAFTEILYPEYHLINSSNDPDIYLGRQSKVVQKNPNTNQKVTTMHTLFNQENNTEGGTFVRPNSVYNKVYYGKVVRSLENIRNLHFQTIRVFE